MELLDKKWWHDCVVYQIYPKSFYDSNNDGIGDIHGIIQKLDYLKKLGVDVLWISPMYQSPMNDNGYDISDYYSISSEFGTMDDMDELIKKATSLNIKIMMDLVVNHTSDQHPWFIESKSSIDSPKRDWYIWKSPNDKGTEPNNWESFFENKAWTFDDKTQEYYLHLFSHNQPDLNWANKEVRQAIYSMMHFWLKKGISGFRMDVINMIGKPQDYPDATIFDQGVAGWEHWANNAFCHQYLREMYDQVLSKYDVLTVGETPFTSTLDGQYYSHPDRNELSMIFQFEHVSIDREEHNAVRKPFDLVEYKKIMSRWQNDLHNKGWNSLYWSNHDQPRAVSRYGNDSPQYREISAKMLATLLHMMEGTPYIYQGEELAMMNKKFKNIDEFDDLMAKFHYQKMLSRGVEANEAIEFLNYFSRDHARLPMQWNNSEFAGFSLNKPWLSINDNANVINAESALSDDDSIFYHYQKLIKLRKSSDYSDTIIYGEYQLLDAEDSHVYSYTRSLDNCTILIICNFTADEQIRSYPYHASKLILNNYSQEKDIDLKQLQLKPYQALIIDITV